MISEHVKISEPVMDDWDKFYHQQIDCDNCHHHFTVWIVKGERRKDKTVDCPKCCCEVKL